MERGPFERVGALAAAALLGGALVACSIDQGALVPADAGDGATPDGAADGGRDGGDAGDAGRDGDTGPTLPCEDFGERHVVAVIAGDALFAEASHEGTEREAPGNIALAANAHRFGVWRVAGHEDAILGAPPALDDLLGHVATAQAYRDDFDVSYDDETPPHELLITGDGSYTVEVLGDIRLAAGTNTLHAEVEDRVVLEVDIDGTTHSLNLGSVGDAEVTFEVARDGWYAMHGAWQSDGGDGKLVIDLTPPGDSRREVWPEEMRSDASEIFGREVLGWENRELDGDPSGSRLEETSTTWSSTGASYPGVGIEDRDDGSARCGGRHLIPGPIDAFTMVANQGGSLFVDGVYLGAGANRTFDSAAPDGMVDVVAELWDGAGRSEMTLSFDGAPFALDTLRPATRFGGVPHGRGAEFAHSIGGGANRMVDVVLAGLPSGETTAVEVSVIIEAVDPGPISVTVTEPGGLTETRRLVDAAWSRQASQWHLRWVPDWADTLTDADGTWEVTVENTGTEAVLWHHVGVLAHLGGVAEPYPRSGVFRTAFIDLGDETLISGIRGGGLVTGRNGSRFGIRGGSAPVDLPFAPTDAAGDLATAIRARFVQIEVNLTGPGWDTPRIRDLRIVGEACQRCAAIDPETCPEERSSEALVALWTFDEGEGELVRDLSAFGTHDLITPTEDGWSWGVDHLALESGTPLLAVDRPIDALREAFVSSGALTVEAWVQPANVTQSGPGRILTISEVITSRNLLLGQQAGQYQGRVRHEGDVRGHPFVNSATSAVSPALQHVVLTRTTDGSLTLWVNGTESGTTPATDEGMANWDPTFRLYLGNENSRDRTWHGEYHLVAMYSRALTSEEIARHLRIGPRRTGAPRFVAP